MCVCVLYECLPYLSADDFVSDEGLKKNTHLVEISKIKGAA